MTLKGAVRLVLVLLWAGACQQPVALTGVSTTLTTSTPAVQVSIVPLEPTATSGPESATATPIPTPRPWPIPTPEWNFKLAYVALTSDELGIHSQVWVLEPPYDTPRLLLSSPPDQAIWKTDEISWSPDGGHLAYIHLVGRDKFAFSVADVTTGETRQVSPDLVLEPFGPGASADPFFVARSWSSDGQWLFGGILYHHPDRSLSSGDFIVNVRTGELIELDQQAAFIAWSNRLPDRYLYIYVDPASGKETVNMGQVGLATPLSTWPKSSSLSIQMILSSDDSKVATVPYRPAPGGDTVWILDIKTGSWQRHKFPGSEHDISVPKSWSPNDQWIALFQDDGIKFITAAAPSERMIAVPEIELSIHLGWVGGEASFLLYQDGNALYAVDPARVEDLYTILDLTALNIRSDSPIDLRMVTP